MASIVGMVIGLVIIAFMFGGMYLIDNPESIPGHEERNAKREARMIAREMKKDRESFTDITDLAVSLGYPRPDDGWYGFNVKASRGVLYLEGRRFTATNFYDGDDATVILRYVLDRLTGDAKEYFKKAHQQKQLEQMVNGQVIGDRTPWVDD